MFEFDLIDVGRLYTRCLHERHRQLNLTHYRALLALAQNGRITQSRLAGLIALDCVTLGRILDRLEANGWAKRHPHPWDRRARTLVITEEARAFLPVMPSVVTELQHDALRGFSAEEKQLLTSSLERMLANLRLCTAAKA
jgi:MarR family transcriptional regulator, transcriptional regulator for hemolysin